MVKFVNAKLNLGLNILRKRADGYHDLETLFYPVGLYNGTPVNPQPFCDILDVVVADSCSDSFFFSGNSIDCPLEKNLVFKALEAFRGLVPEAREVRFSICLDKHIPDGAGLGGGSADAGFLLAALNELTGFPLSKESLIALAATIGADCPFFIENRPVLASGIGEVMSPVDINLDGLWAVIVKPDVYVSTREAFSGIVPRIPSVSIGDIVSHPVEEWHERGLKNDFEDHIFRLFPTLGSIVSALRNQGALYAAMSGSGSSLFGLFPGQEAAAAAASSLSSMFPSSHSFICKL